MSDDTPFDKLLARIEAGKMMDIINSGLHVPTLLDVACPLFERFHPGDQAIALAVMFGIMAASIEGEISHFEQESGMMLGFEERLKLFIAEARTAYRDAIKVRSHPDAPKFLQQTRH